MKKNFKTLLLGAVLLLPTALLAAGGDVVLEKSPNNLKDYASLQRGAKMYVNYCLGCHSLKYTRYKQMAGYLNIVDSEGNVLERLVQDNLNYVSDKVVDPVVNSIPAEDAEKWFGVAPPDLSLVSRSRGTDWLYTYLKGFYKDESRPWGVNNVVFKDVGMPHILLPLEGVKTPVYKAEYAIEDGEKVERQVLSHFAVEQPGEMTDKQYDRAVTDLVNFLEMIGEPMKLERQKMGVFVVLFLIALTLIFYLLKREYWKDVH